MPGRTPLPFALLALAAMSTAALADWPNSAGVGFPLQVGPGNASSPVVIPDGAGGAIFVWSDNRSGNDDIYAQRVSATGTAMWGTSGITVRGGPGNQNSVVGASDGAGGAVFAFADDVGGTGQDVVIQRISPTGSTMWGPAPILTGAGNQWPIGMATLSNGNIGLSIANDAAGNIDLWGSIILTYGAYYSPRVVCNAAGPQYGGPVVPDATGGAYFVWEDFRPVNGNNIFAQRLDAVATAQWAANGIQVSTTNYGNNGFAAAPDGSGNVMILWNDSDGAHRQVVMNTRDASGGDGGLGAVALTQGATDNYVTSVLPDGQGGVYVGYNSYGTGVSYAMLGRFSVGGVPNWPALFFSVSSQGLNPNLAADGDGGVFIAWSETRNGVAWNDSYVQQVSSDGGYVGLYAPTALSNGLNQQWSPTLASDGRGGAIAAWQDARLYWSGNSYDLYAGRIAPFARLGNPEPKIAGVKDVPNDQGGHVTVRWDKSYLDRATNQVVNSYWIWRQLPAAAAQAALKGGARLLEGLSQGAGAAAGTTPPAARVAPRGNERLLRLAGTAAGSGYWEYVGQQPAQGFASYSMELATGGDSVAASNPRTKLMVEAYSYSGHWESAADSGYSVDNLPPAPPAPFVGQYNLGITPLHWNPNHEADLAGYRLFRGFSPSFVTDPSSLVAALSDTGYAATAGHYVYKLTAVDSHGNESEPAVLVPPGTLDAPGAGAVTLSLAKPWPSPAQGPVTLRFALPEAGPVRLAIHDAQGRLVRVLADGERPAGEQTLTWDRRNDHGTGVAAGIYFVRLQAGGRLLTSRFVALD